MGGQKHEDIASRELRRELTRNGIRPLHAYASIHIYITTKVDITIIIFIVTLTKVRAAFPIIIITLVPNRHILMKRTWNREVLRYVNA